jgi:hypothetical protein
MQFGLPDIVASSSRSATARKYWIALQVTLAIPFLLSMGLVIEMTFAVPGKGYHDQSGKYVACEALASRSKVSTPRRCSVFGSKETNPVGYAGALAILAATSAILFVSTRPGRGLRA